MGRGENGDLSSVDGRSFLDVGRSLVDDLLLDLRCGADADVREARCFNVLGADWGTEVGSGKAI